MVHKELVREPFFGLPGKFTEVDWAAIRPVAKRYPAALTPYYASLITTVGDPLWKQCVPDPEELLEDGLPEDPLEEEGFSPVPGLVHRYPDRVLFLVSDTCPVYCRFCTRKRRTGRVRSQEELIRQHEAGLRYIEETDAIRDVLLSGGDPLMLADETLFFLLDRLTLIGRLDLIRIGTRVPCTWPQRITEDFARRLGAYPGLYINTHFNHPDELTGEARMAAQRLSEQGIPLACQTVLLRGVNDHPETLAALFRGLLTMRIRPYYLHVMDLTRGTAHFRVPLERALAVYGALQGALSGMALPRMMLDLPGGGGKVPLVPEYVEGLVEGVWRIRNYRGEVYRYPEVGENG